MFGRYIVIKKELYKQLIANQQKLKSTEYKELLERGLEIPIGTRFLDQHNNWWVVIEDFKAAPYYPKKNDPIIGQEANNIYNQLVKLKKDCMRLMAKLRDEEVS
jgi:hypothetical protein